MDRYLTTWTELGPAVRDYRRGAGLTQSDLARRSGVSRASINAMENGSANPSGAVIDKVLRALGLGIVLRPRPAGDAAVLAGILGEDEP